MTYLLNKNELGDNLKCFERWWGSYSCCFSRIYPSSATEPVHSETHQTQVAKSSWLLFLRGVRMGSPRRPLASMLPAKMYNMEPIQSANGCFREN